MSEQVDWRDMRDNPGELAAWMLRLVDSSPNRLAVIEIPHAALRTNRQIDEAEQLVAREFDRAKQARPDLAIKVRAPTPDYPNAALLVDVHEHQWVGGHCIHGCTDRRPTSDQPES